MLLFAALFVFPDEFAEGIGSGLSICGKVLVPSLFPFLIAASLAGNGTLPPLIKKIFEPLSRFLFGLPADCLPAIILGQVGGYLSGAKSAQVLCLNGTITPNQAERMLLFCVNAGIGFSVNAIGNGLLNSREAGKILLFSLCVSSLMLGIISKVLTKSPSDDSKKQNPVTLPFSVAVVNSVSTAAQSMLTACGFVTVFSGICAVGEKLLQSQTMCLAVTCLLEATKGCIGLAGKVSLPVIAAVCGFGGICVHMQIFSLTREIGINLPRFYFFRLLHSVLAYAVCKITLHFRPITLPVSVTFYQNVQPFSFSAPAAISLLFLCALLILDLESNRKIC